KRVDFTRGLNIVYGPNESGKSTIVESLLFALSRPSAEETKKLVQWNALSSEIKVVYKTDSGLFTLTRGLQPRPRDILEGDTVELDDPEHIEDLLEEQIGITDKTMLENSIVVRQNEMQILQEENVRAKVRNQVKTLLSGVPERSTDESLEFLDKSISKARAFVDRARERIQTIESEIQQYKGIEEEYQELKTRLNVYHGDLARDENVLSGYELLLSYRRTEEEYLSLVKTLEKVENLEGYIRRLPIREKELIQDLQEELDKISVQQDKLVAKKAETREGLAKQKTYLSTIDDELEGVRTEERGILAQFAGMFKSSKAKKEELATRRVEISQNVARLEDLLEQYEEKVSEWRGKFQQKGEHLKQLMEQCAEYESWTAEMLEDKRKGYASQIEEILNGMSRRELEESVLAKRKEADTLRAKLVKNHSDLKDRKDVERVSIEKEKLEEIIAEWQEKIAGLEAQMELLSSKVKKKEQLTEELKTLKIEKGEQELQKKADEIAHDIITMVYKELRETFAPKLEKRAEALLSRITRGKYQDIVVRKDDLDVLVKVPEQEHPVGVDVLSQGTRDQLYLSLRIALSELLSGDRSPPLLFDEAFYTFDDERLRETLKVLKEVASTLQVIVFTHDESYAKYGHPIPLGKRK
ncbi:MAG: AAA family ATPase, partial [Theionarchaea archaeon]|nr:AAA family ATPase [Theionarchaea archaeon]